MCQVYYAFCGLTAADIFIFFLVLEDINNIILSALESAQPRQTFHILRVLEYVARLILWSADAFRCLVGLRIISKPVSPSCCRLGKD